MGLNPSTFNCLGRTDTDPLFAQSGREAIKAEHSALTHKDRHEIQIPSHESMYR